MCASVLNNTFFYQIINKIRSSSLRHRRFKLLMDEMDATYMDIMYFINVRWLSCGKVLNRFSELLPEIMAFIEQENMMKELEIIKTSAWRHELFFLCDLINHLSQLNLKLQGREQFVWDMAKIVDEFKLKLVLFKAEINDNDFTLFPTLNKHFEICFIQDKNNDKIRFIAYIDVLIDEFESRFSDFEIHELAFEFFKNPFDFDLNKIAQLSDILQVKVAHLTFDVALLQKQNHLKNLPTIEMWKNLVSENSFLVLKNVLPKYLCLFSSTYVCECTFSSLVRRKSKYRSMLSEKSLESEIRCELCKKKKNFAEISKSKACQPSH